MLKNLEYELLAVKKYITPTKSMPRQILGLQIFAKPSKKRCLPSEFASDRVTAFGI